MNEPYSSTAEAARFQALVDKTAAAVAELPSRDSAKYDTVFCDAQGKPTAAYGPRRVLEERERACRHCEYHNGARLHWNGDANEGAGAWEHCDECDGAGVVSLPRIELRCAPEKAELWVVYRYNAEGFYEAVARAVEQDSAARCAEMLFTILTEGTSRALAATAVSPPAAGSTD